MTTAQEKLCELTTKMRDLLGLKPTHIVLGPMDLFNRVEQLVAELRVRLEGTKEQARGDAVMQGKLTISKVRGGGDGVDGNVRIRVQCATSHKALIEVLITPAQFAEVLFGLANVPVDIQVENLDKFGLYRHSRKLQFTMQGGWSIGPEEAAKEAKRHLPEGWVCTDTFSSQGSIRRGPNGQVTVNTVIYKWEDYPQEETS